MTMEELGKLAPFVFECRAYDHLNHAVSFHPYFADRLCNNPASTYRRHLGVQRKVLKDRIADGTVSAVQVLDCELMEMLVEIAEGHKDKAIYEAYDAIAVLMRIISVLEGKQKLGKGAK